MFLYVLLGLGTAALALCVASWLVYLPLIMRVFVTTPLLVAASGKPQTDVEECEFFTSDGFRLRGSYLRTGAAERLGVVLFCHELHGDRWGATAYTDQLLATGFDVFAFDFGNHGASDSRPGYEPMPWVTQHELFDVLAAVAYLSEREDADPRGVGAIGVSKGGAAALCAAAYDKRIRALVTDGAFPIDAMQRHFIRRYVDIYTRLSWVVSKLPDACLISFCSWCKLLVGLRRNCRFLHVEQLARRVTQPVFMIHGERDTYVPINVVNTLRGAIAGRTKLWITPGAKHNGAIVTEPLIYKHRVQRFFLRYLAAGRARGNRPPYRRPTKTPAYVENTEVA